MHVGTVAAGGGDAALVDGNGSFNPDVVYVLQTHDGGNILVREKGHAPNLLLLFETGSDEYDWLNSVVAYGQGSQTPEGGVSLNVWQVSIPLECASAWYLEKVAEVINRLTYPSWALRIKNTSLAKWLMVDNGLLLRKIHAGRSSANLNRLDDNLNYLQGTS